MISSPSVSIAHDIRKDGKGDNAGKFPVKIRVTFQEYKGGVKVWNRQYYSSVKGKFFVTPDEFKLIISDSRKADLKAIRREFVALEARALKLIRDFDIMDKETFELHFLATGNIRSIKPSFEQKISELEENGQLSSKEKYESALSVMLEYGGPDLTFGEITPKWLTGLQRWYTAAQKDSDGNVIKPGYSIAALSFHLRCLRHIYKRAINARLVTADQYPFGPQRFMIQSVSNAVVSYLDEELKETYVKFRSKDPDLNYWHDFWRLSYYANGANFKDILHLLRQDIHPKYLEFDRKKTMTTDRQLKKITVPIVPSAPSGKAILEIIARHGGKDLSPTAYVFPVLNHSMSLEEKHVAVAKFVKNCNKATRKIAELLGIEEDITTYTARHTYSYMKLNVLGGSTEMLQDDLGHGSVSTTEEYKKKFALKIKEKYAQGL
jgi:integrase/recombinase XerD